MAVRFRRSGLRTPTHFHRFTGKGVKRRFSALLAQKQASQQASASAPITSGVLKLSSVKIPKNLNLCHFVGTQPKGPFSHVRHYPVVHQNHCYAKPILFVLGWRRKPPVGREKFGCFRKVSRRSDDWTTRRTLTKPSQAHWYGRRRFHSVTFIKSLLN